MKILSLWLDWKFSPIQKILLLSTLHKHHLQKTNRMRTDCLLNTLNIKKYLNKKCHARTRLRHSDTLYIKLPLQIKIKYSIHNRQRKKRPIKSHTICMEEAHLNIKQAHNRSSIYKKFLFLSCMMLLGSY